MAHKYMKLYTSPARYMLMCIYQAGVENFAGRYNFTTSLDFVTFIYIYLYLRTLEAIQM